MMKTRLAVAAGLAAMVTLFTASAAMAYPDPVITPTGGSAADGVVAPGADFTLTGNFGGTDCITWTSLFNSVVGASGSGTDFSVSFTAPEEPGDYSVDITCNYDDGTDAPLSAPASTGGAVNVTPAVFAPAIAQSTSVSFPIQVVAADTNTDPADDNGTAGTAGSGSDTSSGALPDTGGTSVWYLAGGIALVAAGAGGLVVARRRSS